MPGIKRSSSEIRRAALLGIAVAALAHLAPFDVVPRLDSLLFDTFASYLPPDDAGIVVIDPTQPGALATLASASTVTVVSPSAFAIGAVASSAPGEAAAWLLAVGALIALLAARTRRRRKAGLVMLATPILLLVGSGTAFAAAGAWIPVAGPALLAFASGAAAVVAMRPIAVPRAEVPAQPEDARELLRRGELIDAWHLYRELPPTEALLPELYDLAQALAAEGYPEIAADTYLRVALVDPRYEQVAFRLVTVGRPDAFADDGTRERLKAEMPTTLGRYRLLEPIGQGTTGRVYLARDPRINRLVAVKLIDLTLERDDGEADDARDRFRREAETTGRLSHPNIVTVYDMGQSRGRAYIAMEYLKGDLMSRFTTVGNLLPPRLVLELGARMADALDYAHSQNVIHRDIKPGNIMYDSVSGDLKITDFGIARLIDVNRTRTGVVLGTPSFMAPEQIEGGNVKGHTDLFALGVTLYELLTGQLPFRGNSMTKLMFVIVNEPHEPVSAIRPTLPIEVDAVIDRALLKEPTARYQRGADMAADLRAAARMMA